tara:strand:+ start:362 stop:745 length:384 start_codon:yes stop_codon:yes gene_type:complete
MPSIRKRIGYLPSINAQETISKIATKEKISQSKVVGILVEEALIARGGINHQNTNKLIREKHYDKNNNVDISSFNYNDHDELISDKGITYRYNSEVNLSEPKEKFNKELFEQFKQFVLFQKMTQDKK